MLTIVKSMYCVLLEQISAPPAADLSTPTYTPASEGVKGFAMDPVHEMLLHVILLVVIVERISVDYRIGYNLRAF